MDSNTFKLLEHLIAEGNLEDFKSTLVKFRQDEEELEEYSIFIACIKHHRSNFIRAATDVGLNISQKDYFTGDTLLHFAVAEQEIEAVEVLLELDKNLSESNEDGNTPFHYACMTGGTFLAKKLYDAGAISNDANEGGSTPLHLAIVYGHFYLAAYLLSLPEVLESLEDQSVLN